MTMMITPATTAPVATAETGPAATEATDLAAGTAFASVLATSTGSPAPAPTAAVPTLESSPTPTTGVATNRPGRGIAAPGHRARLTADKPAAGQQQAADDPSATAPNVAPELANLVPILPVATPASGSWQAGPVRGRERSVESIDRAPAAGRAPATAPGAPAGPHTAAATAPVDVAAISPGATPAAGTPIPTDPATVGPAAIPTSTVTGSAEASSTVTASTSTVTGSTLTGSAEASKGVSDVLKLMTPVAPAAGSPVRSPASTNTATSPADSGSTGSASDTGTAALTSAFTLAPEKAAQLSQPSDQPTSVAPNTGPNPVPLASTMSSGGGADVSDHGSARRDDPKAISSISSKESASKDGQSALTPTPASKDVTAFVLPAPATPPTAAGAPAPAAPLTSAPLAPTELAAPLIKLRTHGDGDHEMTLMLHPADLGPVNVHVRLTGNEMTIQLASTNDSAHAALHDALPHLRTELQNAGLSSSIDLSLDLNSSSADAQSSSANSQSQRQTDSTNPISFPAERPNRQRESRSTGPVSGLDRWL